MDFGSIVITIIIILYSVVLHELSHGVVADKLGDNTARFAGRLTLNPIPHLDLFASVLLPTFLIFIGSPFIFGAAKPVPVNFYNLRDPKRGMFLVSLAGPATNLFLAFASALPIKLGLVNPDSIGGAILVYTLWINLVLGIFNLIPIPPLDGSKILASLLSERYLLNFFALERFGFFIIIALLFTGILGTIILPPLNGASNILSGLDYGEVFSILNKYGFVR